MKIGIVTPYYYPLKGGVPTHVHNQYLQLKERGHSAKIITSRFEGGGDLNDEDIIRIGYGLPIPINGSIGRIAVGKSLSNQIKKLLSESQFDILHIHEPLVPTLPLLCLKYSQTVNIGTFHAAGRYSLGYYIGSGYLEKYFEKLKGKIAVSKSAANFVGSYLGGEFKIIPNGVDTNRFNPDNKGIGELIDGRINVLYVGRFEKRKGLIYLFEAFKILKTKLGEDCPRLIVVGGNNFKECPYKLRNELKDVLYFAGVQGEDMLRRFYATTDIFCSPAIGSESFGITLLEAMASGKPIVASAISGYNEVVYDNQEGLLVPPRDSIALSEALLHLISNPDRRVEMGKAGRQKALVYSWEKIMDGVISYYKKCVNVVD